MPTFPTDQLINELQDTLRQQQQRIEELSAMPAELLHQRPAPGKWSVLEVLGHLNILGGHYVLRLERVYAKPGTTRPNDRFRAGFWGERMTRAMQPRADGSIPMPMRTMGRFEPRTVPAAGSKELRDIQALLTTTQRLLEEARSRGLDGERITSTLGPVFRFKPGDAFRFTIAHQTRHFLQIERVLGAVGAKV